MKPQALYKLAREVLLPDLEPKGFVVTNGRYTRILDTGVIHLIGFGKDPHGAQTFRVLCGVNANCFAVEEHPYGFIKHQNSCHLTRKGWDHNSGRWPCDSEEEARESLIAVRQLLLDLGIPWLDLHETLSSVADEISDIGSPGLGWMKARLYLLDGDFGRATEAIENYAAWAAKPRNWGTREFQMEDLALAERIRKEIEDAKRTLL